MILKPYIKWLMPAALSFMTLNVLAAVNPDRSLFVHDTATLNSVNFSLDRVMSQLASQMTAANPADPVNGFQLFARMWDAQRPQGATPATGVAQCTQQVNNWPIACRPVEGNQAADPMRFMFEYKPISLVNRFDLRDKTNFDDCGEYRIIFANTITPRNFIIFEGELPNPQPGNARGCLPIQKIWEGLTTQNSSLARAQILEKFYFLGIPASGVRPVVDIRNYALNTGQIRTNQFMTQPWLLKEYKVGVVNARNTVQVVSVKSNPVGNMFNITNTDARAVAFRSNFINGLPSLLNTDLTKISLTLSSNAFNNGQSHAQGNNENNFVQHFQPSVGSAFENAIQARLTNAGSALTVRQTLNRASAMTCGGCHQPSGFGLTTAGAIGPNQSWPNSLGFVHVSETPSNGLFPLSPALTTRFLPARKLDMETYLANFAAAAAANNVLLAAPVTAPKLQDINVVQDAVLLKAKRSG